jgi:hypothetical protein
MSLKRVGIKNRKQKSKLVIFAFFFSVFTFIFVVWNDSSSTKNTETAKVKGGSIPMIDNAFIDELVKENTKTYLDFEDVYKNCGQYQECVKKESMVLNGNSTVNHKFMRAYKDMYNLSNWVASFQKKPAVRVDVKAVDGLKMQQVFVLTPTYEIVRGCDEKHICINESVAQALKGIKVSGIAKISAPLNKDEINTLINDANSETRF